MDFGGMLSNLAINAGHTQIAGANYQQQLAQTEDTRALAQQRQMSALAMKQEMEERKLGLDDAKAGFATVSGGIKTQADIVKGATAAAAIAAGKGHFGVAAEMEKLASGAEDNVRKQSLDAATALQAKKEDMALSANNFLANPTPEGAREVEQKAIAAGVDPRTIPQRSDPAYTPWVKQQVQAPMTSKERLEFRQKVDKANEDRAEKQREFDTAEKRRVAEEARLALDRENNRLLRLAILHVTEERLQLQKDRAAGAGPLTSEEKRVSGAISVMSHEGTRTLKEFGEMAAGSTAGAFGDLSAHTVSQALLKVGTNKFTPEDQQMFQTNAAGWGRSVLTAETAGTSRMPTDSQIQDMHRAVTPQMGDSYYQVAYKLATGAAIILNRLETRKTNPDPRLESRMTEDEAYLRTLPTPAQVFKAARNDPRERAALMRQKTSMSSLFKSLTDNFAGESSADKPAALTQLPDDIVAIIARNKVK